MVKFKLGENLESIAGRGKLEDVIFELTEWADSKGKESLEKLLKGAYEDNPDNEKLKKIYKEYYPFSPTERVISLIQWNELTLILSGIDYCILEEICRKTLISITNNLEDNVPGIINIKNLLTVRDILLEKYPLRKDNIPTIVEFTERLTKYKKIAEADRIKIKDWLNQITYEKGIKLPSYHEHKGQSGSKINSHLLITIEKESAVSKNYILEAELIPNYQEENKYCQTVPIVFDSDGSILCPFDEVKNKIYDFIAKARTKLIKEYRYINHNLIIELFVPIHCFKNSLELEEIPAGNNQVKALGYQYQLVTRCLKRYLINEETNFGQFLTKLEEKWGTFQNLPQDDSFNRKSQKQFVYLNDCNIGNEFAVANAWEDKLALNITGCFSEIENHEIIFNCLLRAGIPISLWHNCPSLTCDEIRQKLEDILNLNSLIKTHILLKSIWRTRQKAHDEFNCQNQQVEAINYFGYSLGLLYDHPYRVPTKFNYAQGSDAFIGYD
ncbi:MAG: hypothetical protein HC815_05525 [Richelia sp. RM1_1_1]|nr:hypothetical protein [Richelia sp. RM1_1_1]